jgi:ferredoxin
MNRCADLLVEVTEEQVAARDARRRTMISKVRELADAAGTPDAASLTGRVRERYEAPLWEEEARTCVECGACNTICPTCHCFLLYDRRAEGGNARFRIWDSCLINDFARVAGGENPRRRLWMRLRNRFDKKFQFFPDTRGLFACTGCGRCTTACPGDIDIRRVLRRLAADG